MSAAVCHQCRATSPEFICFCKEVVVCKSCICSHLLDGPAIIHKPKPMRNGSSAFPTLSTCPTEDPEHPRTRNNSYPALQKQLETLQQFQQTALLRIEGMRRQWCAEVERTAQEWVDTITQKARECEAQIRRQVERIEGTAETVPEVVDEYELQLKFQVKEIDLQTVLKKSVELTLELQSPSARSNYLYKFFGGTNSIVVFDPVAESVVKHVSCGVTFYHNSCSCSSPQGEVFVTGGSLAGRSRNDCFVFKARLGSIHEAQSMLVARRSHASLYHSNYCYVFGGLVDEERTSLCERLSDSTQQWESIGAMCQRRAYFGCCEMKGKVYIVGGALGFPSEIMDFETLAFRPLSVNALDVEDFCSVAVVEDTILVFHGTYRGEVTHWQPALDRVSRSSELGYGNSWSSCAPVIHGGTAFLLRSDNVFRYCIETGENAYVLRMTKKARFQPAGGRLRE